MGPFLVSHGFSYMLLAIDYVSRWVEAKTTRINDSKFVVNFVRSSLVCLEPLSMTRGATSITGHWHPCSRSMGLCIELLQLIIPKLMGK